VPAILVLLLGAVMVCAGVFTVTRRNPIHAALSMLVALSGAAVLMLAMHSPFLAAMQILLYAGAIMVLFVFVIMLLTLKDEEMGPEPPVGSKRMAAVGAILLTFVLASALSARGKVEFEQPYAEARIAEIEAKTGETLPRRQRVGFGSTEHFGRFLYTDYAVPFELLTVLVMAAVAGVITLARRPDRASLERTKLTGGGAA
jgi:NADH-quinone oxidoreductase subunit J